MTGILRKQLTYYAISHALAFAIIVLLATRLVGENRSVFWVGALLTAFFVGGTSCWYFAKLIAPLGVIAEKASDFTNEIDSSRHSKQSLDELQTVQTSFQKLRSAYLEQGSGLRENVAQLKAVLDGMSDGVLAIDGQGRILLRNDAAREMLSLEKGNIMGRQLLEICRIPMLQQIVANVVENSTAVDAEFETIVAPRRVISARATPLEPTDARQGVTLVLRDVTELRRLETMRRDFLSNVSHELKTPLASIKAYAETLLMGAIKDESKNVQFITQIELSADRLAQQIQDLLQLSRVESGSMVFEIGPVSLNVACRNCINRFQSTAMNSMIDLRFDEPAADVIAMADEEGVGTILDNLVSNAIRYTPENGSVTLSVNHQEDWAVVSISDTGIGIAPDKQQRVFERFYRVDKARSREAGGTGLGLSIVKHLVHAFGGNVELSSKLGRGSTFRILLKKPENPAQANA